MWRMGKMVMNLAKIRTNETHPIMLCTLSRKTMLSFFSLAQPFALCFSSLFYYDSTPNFAVVVQQITIEQKTTEKPPVISVRL